MPRLHLVGKELPKGRRRSSWCGLDQAPLLCSPALSTSPHAPADQGSEGRAERFGAFESLRYSDAGGLTQFGAYVETLQPGSQSSDRHWHEEEDEFLYIAVWRGKCDQGGWRSSASSRRCGVLASGHGERAPGRELLGRACTYLIFGTRATHDICHYPDVGKIDYTEGDTWRQHRADGTLIKSGKVCRY